MKTIDDLKKEVDKIEQQNKSEDEEIAWKNSSLRHFLLSLIIYLIVGFALQISNYPRSWLNALAPAVGYLLMMFLLKFAKIFWERNIYKQ